MADPDRVGFAEPGRWRGGRVSAVAECVLAPNPSGMTLEGTNTWILAAPGAKACVVVDPGPDDVAHRGAVLERASVELIILTHSHADHSAGASALAAVTGAPVRGIGDATLADGALVRAGGLEITVLATPGHTSDSACLLLAEQRALLTGDTILGWGSSVVAWPDGALGDYLASLARIEALTDSGAVTSLWPGHGSIVPDARATVRRYREHRERRVEQVRSAWAQVGPSVEAVTRAVYGEQLQSASDPLVREAAHRTVRAHLEFLGHEQRA